MLTFPESPGPMEINSGEEDMMKSAPSPEVIVILNTAVLEIELALTSKLPLDISPGIVT